MNVEGFFLNGTAWQNIQEMRSIFMMLIIFGIVDVNDCRATFHAPLYRCQPMRIEGFQTATSSPVVLKQQGQCCNIGLFVSSCSPDGGIEFVKDLLNLYKV